MPRQTWFDALQMFRLCAACEFVYHDNMPTVSGYPCPRCGTPSMGSNPYFVTTIADIADLITEFYPLPDLDVHPIKSVPKPPHSHALAILIFFCALGEILLQHFLERALAKLNIPSQVQERILEDNRYPKQRVERLFPVLCGVKWKNAIKTISKSATDDFQSTVSFYLDTIELRNKLLHLGNTWEPPIDIAKQCFDHIMPLVKLFIALHNEYLVQP